eukprot:575205-Prymnesium_polylepis.1
MTDPRAMLAPAWWLVHDLCVGPRSRRSRVSHTCHVRVLCPRSPLPAYPVRGIRRLLLSPISHSMRAPHAKPSTV